MVLFVMKCFYNARDNVPIYNLNANNSILKKSN